MVMPPKANPADTAPIPRRLPSDPAVAFDLLKAEAIACVQLYAGQGWTDYNAHDPGVTIIEQLCYALTDLGYRTDFPIADLLAGPDGIIAAGRFGPHPPWRALSTPPVTIADFRRLLLDRVGGLGNVWLKPRTACAGEPAGLYDILLYAAPPLPGIRAGGPPRQRRLAERARRMFLHHRPLGEDIGSIRVLRPLRAVVGATLGLEREAHPEAVMAAVLYRLALAMAPEPRRSSLASVAADAAPEALFEGPLPLNGFIPPAELAEKPATISAAMLADSIADVPGVLGVRGMHLWVEGAGLTADDSYEIDDAHICSLDAGLEGGPPPIVLIVGGRPCDVDRDEVARRLARLWESHRERYALKAAYRQTYEMPAGRARQLTGFTPLAAQFPAAYGLGNGHDRPAGAAAGQLLGFLAIFEMMMVEYCDRLAGLRGLVAGAPPGDAPIGSAALRARIPALAFLAAPGGDEESSRPPLVPSDQQERMLDFLLALYGEDAGQVPTAPPLRPGSPAAARHRVAVKHALLGHVAALARRRGRGFDYRSKPAARRVAGIELRARILLGDHDVANARRRQRIAVVEHVLLRPRAQARGAQEANGRLDDKTVSVVIRLPRAALADGDYRRELERTIRDGLPAHLGLDMHFVDRPRWRQFRRLHNLWCASLRLDEPGAIDWCSVQLRDLLDLWSRSEAG